MEEDLEEDLEVSQASDLKLWMPDLEALEEALEGLWSRSWRSWKMENDLEESARVLIWRPEWESARVLIWRPHWGAGSQPGAQVQGICNNRAKRTHTSRPLMGEPE